MGSIIKAARRLRDWSQSQLAAAADLSQPSISDLEANAIINLERFRGLMYCMGFAVKVEFKIREVDDGGI